MNTRLRPLPWIFALLPVSVFGHGILRMDQDAAATARGTERTVSGSASVVADGRYDWWSHALAVSAGLKF